MLIRADAQALPLRDSCVQCVVTSPPYWGQRTYGGGPSEIGAEASLADYYDRLLVVFAEVWRVLRDDGVLWLNLGDKYANDTKWGGKSGWRDSAGKAGVGGYRARQHTGLKAKDLAGIPWTVALRLRDAGWYLRRDVIWFKPNPVTESVKDRPTTSHEYLFLLTKRPRYYYNHEAILEPYAESTIDEAERGYHGERRKDYAAAGVQDPSETKRRIIQSVRKRHGIRNGIDVKGGGQGRGEIVFGGAGRNKRSVWTIPTQPYLDGDHYAAMPESLVEPCILAGSRPGDLVLDPFIGTGTVGAVADRLMRRWVGVDLSFQILAQRRTAQRGLRMLAEASA